ncbi:hypothetical protein Javan636_0038 [Streptococcus phage Javan636]|uniref:DUF1642 domain-containing protein n=1 Tax=Streptococcus uberis TaxID=1349 RepID=UPI000620284F|nr:DUF1642 domain-containing protein [Streptococcus uberis]KKF49712.1 hypothetical protein AF60_09485 [Streptococcus uberis S6261]QBX31393.1 hypothetical protein Javan636_0038 [Streptococcus phage Javan636]
MKIEEAKEAIKARSKEMAEKNAINSFGHIPVQQAIPISDVIKILDQLDQPKTVLKKEHAEWLEELKNEFPYNLPNQLYHITRQGWGYGLVFESNAGQKIKISNLDDGKLKKDLVNALIYGYTVEKEKLYTVVIPNPHEKQLSYVLMRRPNGNVIINVVHSSNLDLLKTDNDLQLTEAEIRKDFDWAWQWKKEVTE